MFLVYRPDGGDEQVWVFDPNKLLAVEAEAVEKRTGWDWADFGQHLVKGSVTARRALLWTFLRRAHRTLRYEDVTFAVGEVTLEFDVEELGNARAAVEAADYDSDAERTAALAAIDEQIAEARAAPGKAPASSGG